jgi:hypothetical protein
MIVKFAELFVGRSEIDGRYPGGITTPVKEGSRIESHIAT